MRARSLSAWVVSLALVGLGAAAQATPLTYYFTSGQVVITATVSGSPVAGPVTVALSGVQATLDEPSTLTSLSLSMGSSGAVTISPTYLGYNSVTVNFATLTASGGSLSLFDPGPPQGYNYAIGPVNVAGQLNATNLNPINNLTNQPFAFSNPSATGQLFVGITIGSIDPDGPGGAPPLVIKGDFTFEGAPLFVPEPGTALLVGAGFLGIAARRRSARH
jgi:hypothetical protein